MRHALRCGVTVEQFWAMTPFETFRTIEAALWRDEVRQRARVTQAWLTAKLSRARRMPRLEQLLVSPPKRLSDAELARRKQEFKEMTKNVDPGALTVKR